MVIKMRAAPGRSSISMRFRPRRMLRVLLFVIIILFVIVNMHVLNNVQPGSPGMLDGSMIGPGMNLQNGHVQAWSHLHFSNGSVYWSSRTGLLIPPMSLNATLLTNMTFDVSNLTLAKAVIQNINREQYIHNLDKFGLHLHADSVVIVIQAHDRAEYLKMLLDSLRNVRNIHQALLIISHDIYSKELNNLVLTIDFCPVIQIFFPHSLQLNPSQFPGEHPNDCPRNVKKAEAIKLDCNNAASPDRYGHYREAKYCQTKHHWLWKLSFVFEEIRVMKNYEGIVLLLEEDYYVSEDTITVLQMLQNLRKKDCKDCRILTLGNYDKTQNYALNAGKVEIARWVSSKHNMGMAFIRQMWLDIKKCGLEFCNFDDYNWDWTLQHLSMKCIPGTVKVMKMKATRVFHMGTCGVHHKGKVCSPEAKKKAVEKLLLDNKQNFFPNVITMAGVSGLRLRDPKPNGGWGDYRDRQLCYSFIHRNTSELSFIKNPNITRS
ncbi:alpha-1,6-mannosyl-glycoprotein 2-beta-N-acetylglucosaminyltransferase [Octopus bimaculoides]|nr:alpha-1,6-mannosyl-glycoprotein 2-beta-N-acetylglucosaminyltransferase [Octopus bimaculoides]XP_014785997.1 alpha-1,6-mannosyl-glycoprotein 2-beta-N-acetylglucosaminyltransferase [Octopus bimaculoides]XP_052831682.1 alpha-1,6-mannosyl-glycoprotein 2-beta-N-acetylglucosaminyltransferase [Octopus bimaculoides]XP_052831683.1 alpha-1,6-mannosyl-glycoprotein 2-beta-N-acetylglucosaminyltransferase [Octopus bimaculoides]XP_052831684.1 alpha-1,6-mannosyl-glycoprotein 2-beta-N-acetylglucosaminyltrans|eukprot:XP_014785996.1 PREDICTED: alpha-1,6-mannosyl-glycoprotein 2-beta-N-acetylglucosaminyltransferase-like [Octopus bimaculoides]